MATKIVRTFDGEGNIVSEGIIEVPTEQANSDVLDRRLIDVLEELRVITGSNGDLSTDQLSDAVCACAGALISLIRHRLIAYDDTD